MYCAGIWNTAAYTPEPHQWSLYADVAHLCAGSWLNRHSATRKLSISWIGAYGSFMSIDNIDGGMQDNGTCPSVQQYWAAQPPPCAAALYANQEGNGK